MHGQYHDNVFGVSATLLLAIMGMPTGIIPSLTLLCSPTICRLLCLGSLDMLGSRQSSVCQSDMLGSRQSCVCQSDMLGSRQSRVCQSDMLGSCLSV